VFRFVNGDIMAQRAITLSDIKSADWSLMLDPAGRPGSGIGAVVMGVDDVDQCIAIILTTPKGSDVLRPTFGTDLWKYIDAPISEAGPAVVREVTQSITQWEPRVKVLSVMTLPLTGVVAQPGAHVEITVSWQLNLGGAPSPAQNTSVTLAGAGQAG
jgi:phage baseplate assembly protein W